MSCQYHTKISQELNLPGPKVKATIELLNGGATVPFIARYRKEATGSLDEVAVTSIRDRLKQLIEIDKRRDVILKSIKEQKKLTNELKSQIEQVQSLSELEDLYLPYKPKRRTRGTIAKEKGLEPLAQFIFKQKPDKDMDEYAGTFINSEKKVNTLDDALAGARDVMAEWINEDQDARQKMRELFEEKGEFVSKVARKKEKEGIKYKDYYDLREPVLSAPSHRILAMRRGEKEGILMLRILPPEEEAITLLEKIFIKADNDLAEEVKKAIKDSYKRLLSLSMETEIRLLTKERADKEAINVFAKNLRQLLMSPPLGERRIMAVDPGYRTGCKCVCLDSQGQLLANETIYLSTPEEKKRAAETVLQLCQSHKMEFIAIGNGTASRETESFMKELKFKNDIHIVVVSESGASIYSASDVARREFPKHDVTVRGAVSIGRRLLDPLAELVKIDPKSIGVGQYQHDVDQELLKQSLNDVVTSCVNQVGVELNTSSRELLMYVSGIGPTRAEAIIQFRNQNGAFTQRDALKNVSGLGPKAFEQAAGFLRIQNASNPLDASAVHPESYHIINKMVKGLKCSLSDLLKNESLRKRIKLEDYISGNVGLPTLQDIISELAKPGRDPREKFEVFEFKKGIHKPEDLKPNMKLPGIVTNITAFGVFVDIGVHLDGLVHISELSSKYVKSPADVVSVQQKVMVTVLDVDIERKRIALSMKK